MTTKWYDAHGELWGGKVFADDTTQIGFTDGKPYVPLYPNFVIGVSGVRRAVTMDGWIILPDGEVIKGPNGGELRLIGDFVYDGDIKLYHREEDGRLT